MSETGPKLSSKHERVVNVLEGRRPDRHPFCDRLELWHAAMVRQHRLPDEFQGLSLTDIHRRVGMGQLKFVAPYAFMLRGVELAVSVNGVETHRETDPVTERFPTFEDFVSTDGTGVTRVELRTPVGTLGVEHQMLEEAFHWGEKPYFSEHPIKCAEDYNTVHWILERIELVSQFEKLLREEGALGDAGYAIPLLHRVPFQEVLIDFLGEIPTFFALNDEPARIAALLDALHEIRLATVELLADLHVAYVEFDDNLTGQMTNPRLFTQYCLPHYQQYTDLYHQQGKQVGSHTDGELRPLLGLLKETGLDVCESFSPAPLTECTFDEAWAAWGGGKPIMWGVFPSPILEERTPESEFVAYVDHVLETVGDQPVIFGVSDMVLGNNLIERVKAIADKIESHVL